MSQDRSNEFLVMFNIHNFPSQNQYLPIIYSNHPMVLLMQNVSVQVAAFLHTSVDFFFVASKYLIFTWWSISNSRKKLLCLAVISYVLHRSVSYVNLPTT